PPPGSAGGADAVPWVPRVSVKDTRDRRKVDRGQMRRQSADGWRNPLPGAGVTDRLRACDGARPRRYVAALAAHQEEDHHMYDVLRDRIWRNLEALPEEKLYQVLDYIEFLNSKYSREPVRSGSPFQRFGERLEDKLRGNRVGLE